MADAIVCHVQPTSTHATAIGGKLVAAIQAGKTVVTAHHATLDPSAKGDWGRFMPALIASKPSDQNEKGW